VCTTSAQPVCWDRTFVLALVSLSLCVCAYVLYQSTCKAASVTLVAKMFSELWK
jgi:hypothetical protein